jgi:predicted GH43/DUF377 family glycosyl hydrolase
VSKSSAFIVLILLTLLGACRPPTADRRPLKFLAYEDNPVLLPGEPGSWDDLYVINAFVLEDDGLIYLFYTAYSKTGSRALGLATSTDGFHFTKFPGNPILTGDGEGYDAFGVAQAHVLREDSLWVLYFNGREIAGFSTGMALGRATSRSLTGPWTKSKEPVITTGRKGEWDSYFIYLGGVVKADNGNYLMYYASGEDLFPEKDFFIGMATSKDGIHWKKYNDPSTSKRPFAESDPVMMTGRQGEWDENILLPCYVLKYKDGYGMYYACGGLGYATSVDGIHWEKYHKNPVYIPADDPYVLKLPPGTAGFQGGKFLFRDSLCFMYYDYAHSNYSAISLAIARRD